MDCHVEFELFDVKQEKESLSITEIKTEPQDIKREVKTEVEECDIKHDPIDDPVPSVETISEVENQEAMNNWFEANEAKLKDKQKNTENNKTATNLHERKYGVHANTGNKLFAYNDCPTEYSQTQIITKSCNCRNSISQKSCLIHRNVKAYNCKICDKFFSKKNYLTRHIRLHANEKPFNCDLCSKLFSNKRNLSRHIRIHTNEKPFSCMICRKLFTYKSDVDRHIRHIHSNEKPFTCYFCNKSFSDKFHLSRHMQTHDAHSNEKPICDFCMRTFSSKLSLFKHRRIHINETSFTCNFCKKVFPYKSSLYAHTRIHTNEKPFKCGICSQFFTYKCDLSRHIRRIHTNEKPFTCNFCSKPFSDKSKLSQHTRIHERPPNQ